MLEGGGGGEDPLDNEEQLGDQLDALPFLCRFQYDATSAYLLALMDPVLGAYQSAAAGGALFMLSLHLTTIIEAVECEAMLRAARF